MSTELWTVEQVADWLKKSKTWVYRQVKAKNRLPHRRIGGELRFVPVEVEQWALGEKSSAGAR